MDTNDKDKTLTAARRLMSVRYGLLFLIGFTALVLTLDVAINVFMEHVVPNSTSSPWGNIGQGFESVAAIFSALGLAALVVTFLLQYKELQLQRYELENQRHEMSRTQAELHRSAEVDLRRLHVELLKMAIDDEGLGAVWPAFDPAMVEYSVRRQYWYANLIYQHLRLALDLGSYTDEAVKATLKHIFKSRIMRDYWRMTADARVDTLIINSSEWRFAQIADAICNEYNDEPPDQGLRLVE